MPETVEQINGVAKPESSALSLPLTAAQLRANTGAFSEQAIHDMAAVYHPDVYFRDPIQTVRGRDAFVKMNLRMLEVAEVEAELHDVAQHEETIFMSWRMVMHMRRGGIKMPLEGTTIMKLDAEGRVLSHVDHWDLLGSLMDMFPRVGPLYRKLIARLG